jgi:hypothetical protein
VGHRHERADPTTVDRGGDADPPREQIAEASEAGKAHFHADPRDRILLRGQQQLRAIQPRVDTVLMRRLAEHRLEAANEVKRRHGRFARHLVYQDRAVADFPEAIPGAAQGGE